MFGIRCCLTYCTGQYFPYILTSTTLNCAMRSVHALSNILHGQHHIVNYVVQYSENTIVLCMLFANTLYGRYHIDHALHQHSARAISYCTCYRTHYTDSSILHMLVPSTLYGQYHLAHARRGRRVRTLPHCVLHCPKCGKYAIPTESNPATIKD